MDKISENSLEHGSEKNCSHITNKVFDNELLLDMILDYVIHDENPVYIPDAYDLRPVNRAWLESTSRILLKYREPLFRFSLCKIHMSGSKVNYTENEQLLDNFLASVNGASRLSDKVPPYSIRATRFFLNKEKNHQRLFGCLTNCGSSLVELDLEFTETQELMPVNNNLELSKLQKFTVRLNNVPPASVTANNTEKLNNKIDFIQSIFDASERLKTLGFLCSTLKDWTNSSLSSLILPPSIAQLHCETASVLEAAVKSSLPKLNHLNLYVYNVPFEDGLITTLLLNVRTTLKYLHVYEKNSANANHRPNKFQLPLMEKLESLKILTSYLELEESFPSLEKLVPVLNHMSLTNQTISMFEKWTDRSCFPSVNSVSVSLVIGDYGNPTRRQHKNKRVNFDRPTMEVLKRTFPNVQKLSIMLVGTEVLPLKFIMEKMRNLQRLQIVVDDTEQRIQLSGGTRHWDAHLIGIDRHSFPTEEKFLDAFSKLDEASTLSVRNLTKLQTLELMTLTGRSNETRRRLPLISLASFQYGFLKMPILYQLILKGNFYTSKFIAQYCRDRVLYVESVLLGEDGAIVSDLSSEEDSDANDDANN